MTSLSCGHLKRFLNWFSWNFGALPRPFPTARYKLLILTWILSKMASLSCRVAVQAEHLAAHEAHTCPVCLVSRNVWPHHSRSRSGQEKVVLHSLIVLIVTVWSCRGGRPSLARVLKYKIIIISKNILNCLLLVKLYVLLIRVSEDFTFVSLVLKAKLGAFEPSCVSCIQK